MTDAGRPESAARRWAAVHALAALAFFLVFFGVERIGAAQVCIGARAASVAQESGRKSEAKLLTTDADQKANLSARSREQAPVARPRALERWDAKPPSPCLRAGAPTIALEWGRVALVRHGIEANRVAALLERTLESTEPRQANQARGPPAAPVWEA